MKKQPKKRRLAIIAGLVCFAAVAAFNIQYALDGYGVKTNSLHYEVLAQTSTGTSGGSSSCCTLNFWGMRYPACIRKLETVTVTCNPTYIVNYSFSENGATVGGGYSLAGSSTSGGGGSITITWGRQTGNYTTTTTSRSAFQATKVLCPTNGNCNTCQEYDPCTH